MRKKKTVDEKICDALDLEHEEETLVVVEKPSGIDWFTREIRFC